MYIAIDLGATNVRIAGSENLEHFSFYKIERFELSHNFENDFAKIIQIIENIASGKIDAIGIGSPGTFNEDKQFLVSATNLPEWVDVSFVAKLAEKFNCRVFADNDAVVASFGEVFFGKNKQKEFIYITWGTGIGGAQVKLISNKVFSKKIDRQIYLREFEDKCGGKKIHTRFNKSVTELNENEWKKVLVDFIFYFEKLSEKFDEKVIVLGGGATSKQKKRLQTVVEKLAKKGIDVIISNLDDEIGLYGAMALIQSKE